MTVQEFELLKQYESKRYVSVAGKTRIAKNLRDEVINNQHAYGFKIVGLAVLLRIYCDVKNAATAKVVNEVYKAIGEIDPQKESFVTLYCRAFNASKQLDPKEKEAIAGLIREVLEYGIGYFIKDEALKTLTPPVKAYLHGISQIAFEEARNGNLDVKDELLLLHAKFDRENAKEALERILRGRPYSKVARNKVGCEALLFRAGIDDNADEQIQALDVLADKKYNMGVVLKIAKKIAFKRDGSDIKAIIQKINKLNRKKPGQAEKPAMS